MAEPESARIWTTACPDWERRIVAGDSLIVSPPLFPAEAEAALETFKSLHVVDLGTVDSSPTMGEISRPWVLDLVAAIFGAYDPESGRRLIREFFLLISKKNGKSTDAAGIIMTALLLNWRLSGEMGILAPTVEVANNAYLPARDMVRADEELSDLLLVQDHIRTITHRATGAKVQVVAADSETVAGKKWTVTLVDELWLFGKRPNAHKMLLEATGGMASRPEGFVVYLSTQSDDEPAGVFAEKLQYARKVRDGEIVDPEFLPVLYEFPPAMIESKKYLDESTWYITNPNLGAGVDAAYIRRKIMEAQSGTGEATLQAVLSKHLNVEIGVALRGENWAGAAFWEKQGDASLNLVQLLERCEVVTAGVDFGGVDDWLALAIVGRDRETGRWLHWAHAWAHPIAFERRKSEASRWRDFVADGDLTIVEQIGDEVSAVIALIMRCEAAGLLERIGVDRYKIQDIYDGLVQAGIAEDRIVAIDQGWKLVGAIATTERRLAAGTFHHGATRMMAYCVGNAKVEVRGNNISITKQIAGAAKIDPLMATFNANSLMALNPEAVGSSKPTLFFL